MYLIFTLLITCSFIACNESDNFSNNSGLKLDFSEKKITFDTVFTSIGSATHRFMIYNRNDNSLNITSAELAGGTSSNFRINIDGQKGSRLTNIDILKNDSLYGFVEVTVNPAQSSSVIVEDSIRFITNGNTQYVHLRAIGQNVHIWRGRTLTTDTTLTADRPFLIYDSLVVKNGAKLNIQPGCTFYMYNNSAIRVHGSVQAEGTIDKPIIFRGSRFDKVEGDIPYDNMPGQWDGIYFYPTSMANVIRNTHIRNNVNGVRLAALSDATKKATLENVIIQNTNSNALTATNCWIEATNCLFANTMGSTVNVQGGRYRFLHCTIANYFSWSARQRSALIIGNPESALNQCNIINSIVYGTVRNEVDFVTKDTNLLNFRFINCLLKYDEQASENYTSCLFNVNPLFANLNKEGIYSYNFRLSDGSPAIGKGDITYTQSAPYDINGYSRLTDGKSDLGCYEKISEK